MPDWFMLTISDSSKKRRGFTIIEVMVALFIVAVGIVGVSGILSQTLAGAGLVSSKLTASYLAQEGVEIVRNIRDGNWLEQRSDPSVPWDDGIPSGNWQADYSSLSLSSSFSGSGNYLNIAAASGFYSYSAGLATKFKRKITISKDIDVIEVTVTVTWQEKSVSHSFIVQENLYNWYTTD